MSDIKTVGDLRRMLADFDDETLVVVLGFDGWGFDHPDEVGPIEIAPYGRPATGHSPTFETAGRTDAAPGPIRKALLIA